MQQNHQLIFTPSSEKIDKHPQIQQIQGNKLEYDTDNNHKLTVDDLKENTQNSLKQQQQRKNIYDTPTFESDAQYSNQKSNIYINQTQKSNPLNNHPPSSSLSSYQNPSNIKQNQRKIDFTSIESDFDMSETKLNQLGLQQKINQEVQDYSNLLKNYNRQFSPKQQSQSQTQTYSQVQQQQDNSVSTRFTSNRLKDQSKNYEKYSSFLDNTYNSQSQNQTYLLNKSKEQDLSDISIQDRIKSFQQKLQNIEENFNHSNINSPEKDEVIQQKHDPYHVSIHSMHMNSIQNELRDPLKHESSQQEYLSESENTTTFHKLHPLSASQKNLSKTSYSSSRKPPISQNLVRAFGTEEEMKKNLHKHNNNKQNEEFDESFQLSKLKYYDSFLPENMKIMNCPIKMLKFKMQNRQQDQIKNCMAELEYMNQEISNNLFQTKMEY